MKVLTIDIETSPALAWVWGLRDQNIAPGQVEKQVEMICFAAKWLDRKKMYFRSVHHDGQEAMLAEVHALLDEADVVIHYNGQSFDIPHINRELKLGGFGPPSPFLQIDLYRTVRSKFRFMSNKLDSVAGELEIGQKVKHEGFGLWKRCMAGDDVAWAKMRRYNKGDVTLTEDLYYELRPWISTHPAMSVGGAIECPRCTSRNMMKRGTRRTAQATFQEYQCTDCGGYSRSTRRLVGSSLRSVV